MPSRLLADALGLSELAERINEVIHACAEPEPPPKARYLRGLRVAIVGDHSEVIGLRDHAESYGAKLAVNITKTVNWMVAQHPTPPTRATQRRANSAFRSSAPPRDRHDSTKLSAKRNKAAERQRELDHQTAQRRQRADEADAYWRPSWRPETRSRSRATNLVRLTTPSRHGTTTDDAELCPTNPSSTVLTARCSDLRANGWSHDLHVRSWMTTARRGGAWGQICCKRRGPKRRWVRGR